MIDRGALVLARAGRYRGPRRTPLDGMTFTGRTGRALGQRYTQALIEGEGVMEDLDEAIALRDAAMRIGLSVEAVVFEVPQQPAPTTERPSLPVLETPPADGTAFLGWDVIELVEPWDSPLAGDNLAVTVNEHGLLSTRAEAEALAQSLNATQPDEPWVAVRVWAVA